MKYIIVFITLTKSTALYADLFDIEPISLCKLFESEGVITTTYSTDSYSKSTLCYTPDDNEQFNTHKYRLTYRVLGNYEWPELTNNVFIEIEGIESEINKSNILSKYKVMAYKLIDKVTKNTAHKEINKIVGKIINGSIGSSNAEAINIKYAFNKQKFGNTNIIRYRLDLDNQCIFHPKNPNRIGCLNERTEQSNK